MAKASSKKKSKSGSAKKAKPSAKGAKKKKAAAPKSGSKKAKPAKKKAAPVKAKKAVKKIAKKVAPKAAKKKGQDWVDSFEDETEKVEKTFDEGEEEGGIGEEEPTKLDDFNFESTPEEEEEEEGFYDENF